MGGGFESDQGRRAGEHGGGAKIVKELGEMDHMTGTSVIKLMRQHGKTIAGVARSMNISQARVRQVRAQGVKGRGYVMDWMEAITGDHRAGWAVVAQAYLQGVHCKSV